MNLGTPIRRAIKKQVYLPMKSGIRKTLLRVLMRMDESIEYNVGDAGGRRNGGKKAPRALDPKSRNASLLKQTQVLNEEGAIVNAEMLKLYFHAIFKTSQLNDRQIEAWKVITKDPKKWLDHPSLVRSLREYFKDDSETLKTLDEHVQESEGNRLVYSADSKERARTLYWPDPTDQKRARSILDEYPFAKTYGFIDRDTSIGSAGSCFAIEIAHRLQKSGYRYLVTEPDIEEGEKYSNASARWGIIFNTPSFRQLVEKAFGVRDTPRILWTRRGPKGTQFLDPFREDVIFDSIDEYEKTYDSHREAARKVLSRAKVFVLTLGVNEVWRMRGEDFVFSRAPWRIASALVEKHVMSVEENVSELQEMLDLWRAHNPDLKLIVSVSPVPLHATFRSDEHHVIAANAHSKSVLRVVAEEFCSQNKDVYYFPSYESVLSCTSAPWASDQRHVSREAVDKVMRLFGKMFLKSGRFEV